MAGGIGLTFWRLIKGGPFALELVAALWGNGGPGNGVSPGLVSLKPFYFLDGGKKGGRGVVLAYRGLCGGGSYVAASTIVCWTGRNG